MKVCDILIRNGLIVDGSGAPAFVGDLAVKDGVIVDVGTKLDYEARDRVVDATNRVVSPGWVDVHTHLDGQVTWDRSMEPFTSNGVTTVVMGNCGVGFSPCKKNDRRFLMELMEGVEDIPLGSMEMGIDWQWETFAEFLDFLDSGDLGCDVAALIGHGAVRAFVLGERANLSDRPGGPVNDPVTTEEMHEMASVVRQAINDGAIGFSTSRTLLHRDRSGVLVPGTLAGEEELMIIGKAIAEGGGGVFEMASDFMSYDDKEHNDEDHAYRLAKFAREWVWMNKLAKGYNVQVNFCMGIPSQDGPMQNGFRSMLTELESSRASGANITCQVFVRPQGVLMNWDSKSHPFVESKTFAELKIKAVRAGQPIDRALLADPEIMKKIVEETRVLADNGEEGVFGLSLPQSTDTEEDLLAGNLNGAVNSVGALAHMMATGASWIFKWSSDYEPTYEDSARAHAEKRGVDPLQVIYEWLLEDNGSRVLTFLFMNYSKHNLNDTFEMLTHSCTIPGLGDAGAHLGFLNDATSHTYLLTHWVRDKKTGPKLTLEQAVKLHSHDTASAMGMHDRGLLQVGKKADINVINLDKLTIHCPKMVYDLPKGASRWVQTASGYDMTILNGKVTHMNDRPTGVLSGKLVRNPKTFSAKSSYENLAGNISMMLSTLKWEAKAATIKVLAKVLGAQTLEEIGYKLNASPLPHVANL